MVYRNITNEPVIASATLKQLYDRRVVQEKSDQLPVDHNWKLKGIYESMISDGPERFALKFPTIPSIDFMYEEMPNFHEPLDTIRREIALCADSNDGLTINPILLLGDPGIGKTHFAERVSEFFGTGFNYVSMASQTAGFLLSGASSQWKDSRPGMVFETLVKGDYINPVILIDEIDKASGSDQYNPPWSNILTL